MCVCVCACAGGGGRQTEDTYSGHRNPPNYLLSAIVGVVTGIGGPLQGSGGTGRCADKKRRNSPEQGDLAHDVRGPQSSLPPRIKRDGIRRGRENQTGTSGGSRFLSARAGREYRAREAAVVATNRGRREYNLGTGPTHPKCDTAARGRGSDRSCKLAHFTAKDVDPGNGGELEERAVGGTKGSRHASQVGKDRFELEAK